MEQVDWKTYIKAHPVFSSLTRKEIDHVLKVAEPHRCPAGAEIVREGDHGDSVFLIGSGTVKVLLHWGDEQTIQLATLREGEFFGEMALFEDTTRRSASVSAATDCALLEINGKDFLALAAQHPEIEATVIGKLTARLRDVSEHVIKVKLKNLDDKLGVLNIRVETQQQATEATLKATQTIFDQTNRRANEIIESAERRSHRLSQTVSLAGAFVGVVVAAFGVVGWGEVSEFKELRVRMEEEMKETFELTENTKKRFAAMQAELVDFQKEKVDFKALVTETQQDLASFKLAKEELASNIILPAFREALDKNSMGTAANLFLSSLQLRPKDYGVKRYLVEIEQHMAQPKRASADPSPAGYGDYDYRALLQRVLDEATEDAHRIQANYLLLANAILNQQDRNSYDDARTKLEKAIHASKSYNAEVRNSLYFNRLVKLMNEKDQLRACALLKLVSAGDGADVASC